MTRLRFELIPGSRGGAFCLGEISGCPLLSYLLSWGNKRVSFIILYYLIFLGEWMHRDGRFLQCDEGPDGITIVTNFDCESQLKKIRKVG